MQHSELIYIGTSGWDYPQWRSRFYPDELARENWLAYYGQQFRTLEINHSFYQLPEKATLAHWRTQVPEGFRFAIKANRYITHNKKLKDPQEPVAKFMDRVVALEDTLGPILFQLPPRWHCNLDRLQQFLQTLPKGFAYSFEFRNRTWHCPEVYNLLANHGAAFCIFDLEKTPQKRSLRQIISTSACMVLKPSPTPGTIHPKLSRSGRGRWLPGAVKERPFIAISTTTRMVVRPKMRWL